MIQVKKEGILLAKTTYNFEKDGVLNPAAIREGGVVHLFYRAVSSGNHSCIGYCMLEGPLHIKNRLTIPLLSPEFDYESQGMEDPRIVKIDNLYYLTYTAFDGLNAQGCLAVSKDLIHFEKKGIIVPGIKFADFENLTAYDCYCDLNKKYLRFNLHNDTLKNDLGKSLIWDKNLIFFPRRIKEKLYFLHRIRPDIQIVGGIERIEELTADFYREYFKNFKDHILLTSRFEHEISYVGGGCPPIETEHGWLLIYHGVRDGLGGYVYSACAALLDLDNPRKEIARLPYPLFSPEMDWEKEGEVNNVCFPTGAVVFDDQLYIYYGAADERIACASVSFSELINELTLYIKKDDQ